MWMQVSFCSLLRREYLGRFNGSIAENVKFDWLIQVTWKQRAITNPNLFEQTQLLAGTTTQKLANTPVGAGGSFSQNRILLYYFQLLFTVIWRSSSK